MYQVLLFTPGGWEIAIIVFAIILLFGGKKIPELMRGIGKGIREFNTAKSTIKKEIEEGMDDEKKSDEPQKKAN